MELLNGSCVQAYFKLAQCRQIMALLSTDREYQAGAVTTEASAHLGTPVSFTDSGTRSEDVSMSADYCNLFHGPPKRNRRRQRVIFDDATIVQLNMEFHKDQYPCVTKREQIADKVNIPESRIHTWFQNKRSRVKKNIRAGASPQTCSSLLQLNNRNRCPSPPTPSSSSSSSSVSSSSSPSTNKSCKTHPYRPTTSRSNLESHALAWSRSRRDLTQPLDLRIGTRPIIAHGHSVGYLPMLSIPERGPDPGFHGLYKPQLWMSPVTNVLSSNMLSMAKSGACVANSCPDQPSLLFTPSPLHAASSFQRVDLPWIQSSTTSRLTLPQQDILKCSEELTLIPNPERPSPVLDEVTDSSGYTSSSLASPDHSPIDVCN